MRSDRFADYSPDRETDPRDDRTGWEREYRSPPCACGRPVVVAGRCTWCSVGITKCRCGEVVNATDAPYIIDAGYPEHAYDCRRCMPRSVMATVRAFVGRGEP
jgi:hypothetical protein